MATRSNYAGLGTGFAAALLAGCGGKDAIPVVGTVERHRIEVAAPFSEQIVSMSVREGDRVRQGDTLAELDASAMDASRAASAAQLRQLQARYSELRNGARRQELTEAQANVDAAQAATDQAAREYHRLADLFDRGLVAASQLDSQRQLRDTAMARVVAARAALDLLRQGTRSEQLAQAQAAVHAGEQQLSQQSVLRKRLQLVAPIDGSVEALPYRLGERPMVGAPVVVLLDAGMPFARVYVPEPELARMHAGAEVLVQVDGVTQLLKGKVRYVSGEASYTPYFALTQRDRSRLSFLAEIDLPDEAARSLPVGLPVTVSLGQN